MRRLKTLCVILVASCLALSSLMASPSTWGWLQSDRSSEVSELPAETLTEEQPKSMTASKGSKTSSDDEYIVVKKSELSEIVNDAIEGNNLSKKGGAAVTEAVDSYVESAEVYKSPSKFQTFGIVEGAWNPGQIELGVSVGFIFKDCLIGKVGVAKKDITDMSDWLDWKNAYKATFGIGIIF